MKSLAVLLIISCACFSTEYPLKRGDTLIGYFETGKITDTIMVGTQYIEPIKFLFDTNGYAIQISRFNNPADLIFNDTGIFIYRYFFFSQIGAAKKIDKSELYGRVIYVTDNLAKISLTRCHTTVLLRTSPKTPDIRRIDLSGRLSPHPVGIYFSGGRKAFRIR